MTPALLPLLMCPQTKSPLRLSEAELEPSGRITSGWLISTANINIRYPIIRGIPRFAISQSQLEAVAHFAQQWNYFDYSIFRHHFEKHTMNNTFGSLAAVSGQVVVDAGAGSGAGARWMAEAGAAHVIALELSGTVDTIITENTKHLLNVDVIQCSIDAIPLRDNAIPGMVICRNAIHHTPSVSATLAELWRITAPGAECAFNCYITNPNSSLDRTRQKLYRAVRALISSLPFHMRLAYAHTMAALRLVPGLGKLLQFLKLVVLEEPRPAFKLSKEGYKQLYRSALLGTFDYFGAHTHQHHLSLANLHGAITQLRPGGKAVNAQAYFSSPQPSGILLRLRK